MSKVSTCDRSRPQPLLSRGRIKGFSNYRAAAVRTPFTLDQLFLDRPGNDAIQLNLLHNYQSNLAFYDNWHEFFRNKQPKTLIVWGKNDPFFTIEGAQAYLRDMADGREFS